jgi:hypothetical protein
MDTSLPCFGSTNRSECTKEGLAFITDAVGGDHVFLELGQIRRAHLSQEGTPSALVYKGMGAACVMLVNKRGLEKFPMTTKLLAEEFRSSTLAKRGCALFDLNIACLRRLKPGV